MSDRARKDVLHEIEEELFVRDVSNVTCYVLFREGRSSEYHFILPGVEAVVLDLSANGGLLEPSSRSLPAASWELEEVDSAKRGQDEQYDVVLSNGRVLTLGSIMDTEVVQEQTMVRMGGQHADFCLVPAKSSPLKIPRNRFSADTPWYSRRSGALRKLSFVGAALSLWSAFLFNSRFDNISNRDDPLSPVTGPSAGTSLLIALAFLVLGVSLGIFWAYLRFREPKRWGWSKASQNQSTVFETLERYGTSAACAWSEVADSSDMPDQLPAVRGAIASIQELRWRGEKERQSGIASRTDPGLPLGSTGRSRLAQIAGAMIQQGSLLLELADAARSCATSQLESEGLKDSTVHDQQSADRVKQVEALVMAFQSSYADVWELAGASGSDVGLPDPWDLPASQAVDAGQEVSVQEFEFVPDTTAKTLESILHEGDVDIRRSARLLLAQLRYLDQAMALAVAQRAAQQAGGEHHIDTEVIEQSLKRAIGDTRARTHVWQELRDKQN